jgi:hypothetical protein
MYPMDASEILAALTANIGKRVRITFGDSVTQVVEIDCVDDEGFLHSGDGGGDPQDFWTRFEDVESVYAENSN